MATIKYCSWATGDDTNGDGSASNPYKTIQKASTGLTGGDEVRVAKSPEPTNLTGTLAFTNNSTAVVGTNTLFTSELAIGDFVKGGDGYWWEAVVITDDTHLTLYKVYAGSTASSVSSQKLGITSTGEGSSDTPVQSVNASGTGAAKLMVSGGWDLSSETQTGQTFFRQMHSTFANRYGSGLYTYGKNNIEISRLHFLRYFNGIYLYANSNNNTVLSPICCSSGQQNIYIGSSSQNNTIVEPICNASGYHGLRISSGFNNTVISPVVCSNAQYGVHFDNASNNTIYGTLTASRNASGDISGSLGINYISKANAGISVTNFTGYSNARVFINDIGGDSQIWTDYANCVMQDATAGGTGKEWKLNITSANRGANYPFGVVVAAVPVNANKQVTVKLYFKKSGTGIAGRLFIRGGQIAGVDNDIYTNCPDDTNRNQVTLQFTPTEKGVVEIEAQAWYVSSTTQSVIVDDIDITQAD